MAFGGVGGSAAAVGHSPVYRRFSDCAAADVCWICDSGFLRICLGGMAISECPGRETCPAADISLIVENRGVTLAELGFRFTRGSRGRNNGEPQLSTPDIQPAALGCICSKLGIRLWGEARPG